MNMNDLFKQDDFAQQYELAKSIGDKRFGSPCEHIQVRNGKCLNCFRSVVTEQTFTPDATLEDIIARLESRQTYITAQVMYEYIVKCDIQGYSYGYIEEYCEAR